MRVMNAPEQPTAERILSLAAELTGCDRDAEAWFNHHPIPGWAGKTAADLVRDGRSSQVFDYLLSVQHGVYA